METIAGEFTFGHERVYAARSTEGDDHVRALLSREVDHGREALEWSLRHASNAAVALVREAGAQLRDEEIAALAFATDDSA